MKEFKYDTHVHTKEASACARSTAAEIVRRYHRAGYSGFAVTDHFFGGNTSVPRDLDWETRIDLFCKGYENAKKEAEKYDMTIFFGLEAAYSGTEFLIYGIDKKWLKSYPDMMSWSVTEFLDRVRDAGGFVSHAHPFRQREYIKKIKLIPQSVDAAEVYNSGNGNSLFDDRALWYADSYGLFQTSGSDTHSIESEIFGGMVFQRKLKDDKDFISAIKSNETIRLIKGEKISQ